MEGVAHVMNATDFKAKRQPFISDETFMQIMFINSGVITSVISIIGIVTNILNIVTFIRQGFNETINISLTALAVADFVGLICLLWMSIAYIPAFCDLICDVIDIHQVVYILGGMQRQYFTIVAGCITTVIACERCLCVIKPLQVKVILTRGKLIFILVGVYIFVLILFLPLCFTTGLGWMVDPATNQSMLTLNYQDHLKQIDFICFGVMVAFSVVTYVVVTLCTGVIVMKLTSQSAWRAATTKENVQGDETSKDQSTKQHVDSKKGMSGRDRRATKTVTFIAVLYIVGFFPGTTLILTMSFVPDFNKGMFYKHIYEVLWSIAYIFESICSSANIVVYLKTSTRFKEAFVSLFKATGTDRC